MEHQLTKEELRDTKIEREEFKNIERNNIYIVLDNFKVHYNIGTVFRLADAILAKKVYLCGTTCMPPNDKIKKTSIGAEKWVPYEYVENTLDIVTNPPYFCADKFIQHALEISKSGTKIAMLFRLAFLEGQKRYEMFKKYPHERVYVFSKRLNCAKNAEFEKYKSSAIAFAWFIWEVGYAGKTELKWIE